MPINAIADFDLADFDDGSTAGREEEALFARDENDLLVRREMETRERFLEEVTINIDGFLATVPRAIPKIDALGNELRDSDGQLIPRTTTIYDAAVKLVQDGSWSDQDLKQRIPVLCHAPHLNPVGMCRMCSVHISSIKKGRLTPGRKLVPACQHRVERDMVVTTRFGAIGHKLGQESDEAEAVASFAHNVNVSVSMLAEFLLADHRHPDVSPVKRLDNDLENVALSLGVFKPRERLPRNPGGQQGRNRLYETHERARRFELPIVPTPVRAEELTGDRGEAKQNWREWNALIDEKYPYSSPSVVVDHDRCILCDRCARSCSEVKPFKVIGHTGKGYNMRISFDLDALMRDSSCVQCGECMTACPTGALSLRRRVQPRAWPDSPRQIPLNPNTSFPADSGFLTADEMQTVWLAYQSPTRGLRVVYPFASVPYSYLKWNEGAVRRWEITAGQQQVLCREGEYGSTAFLLQGTGQFHIYTRGDSNAAAKPGFFGRLFGRSTKDEALGRLIRTIPGNQLILGEMACLNHLPRNATVVAEANPEIPEIELVEDRGGVRAVVNRDATPKAIVYEITRNMLDMMQRSLAAREDIEEIYASRSLENAMFTGPLFAALTPEQRHEAARFLLDAKRTDGKRAVEFRFVEPGESVVAQGDLASSFYVVRLGFLRVEQTVGGRDLIINLLKRNDYFGEVALLADDLRRQNLLPRDYDPRMRTATVVAIDSSELIRVPGPLFLEMCDRFPDVKARMVEGVARIFRPAAKSPADLARAPLMTEFVNQGLYQGQKMLALDLTRCTRCDECTRACADSHEDGHARLLREGLRFGDFLVATSCRSCHRPYCMDGCPVDAIHRQGDHLEVIIEDHCIGCSLCERNCPYGSIRMVPNPAFGVNGPTIAGFRQANNCDLCNGSEPFCVSACPHEAAFRVDGNQLLTAVAERTAGGKLTVF